MKFEVIGHRGHPRAAPENTIASFKAALDAGADGIELDIHETKDGNLVVMHDRSLWRTAGRPGNISDYTLEQLKKMDVGFWFGKEFKNEHVPSLEEVLSLDAGRFFLEMKNYSIFYPHMEEKIVETIKSMGMEKKCTVISFNHGSVEKIKGLEPKISAGKLFIVRFPNSMEGLCRKSDCLCPFWPVVNKGLVSEAHKMGNKVDAWTVNRADVAEGLARSGVDFITTESIGEIVGVRESI